MLQQYNCPNCNAPVVSSDKFCWHCGTANCWSSQQQVSASPPEQPPVDYKPDIRERPLPQQPEPDFILDTTLQQPQQSQQPAPEYRLETSLNPPSQKQSQGYSLEPAPPPREVPNNHDIPASLISAINTQAVLGDNTSGLGKQAIIPPEIQRWNWGAFFLTWMWGIGNSTWIALLAILPIPLVQIVMAFILGAKGNEWPWRNKRWHSIEHFQSTQRTWCYWGLGIIILGILLVAMSWIFLEPFSGTTLQYTY